MSLQCVLECEKPIRQTRETSILVVDDDPAFRSLVKLLLAGEGVKIRESANGVEGIAQLRCGPTDLLITDIVMPDEEGLAMIIEARKNHASAKILAVSGVDNFGEYLRLARLLGAHATLVKSSVREKLRPIVHELLSQRG